MSKQQGFSLIEILVVLVIISIMFSVATLNVGDFGRHYFYRFQLEELANKVNQLREQAVLSNQIYSFQLDENQISFYRFNGVKWQAMSKDRTFKPISFDKSLKLTLESQSKSNRLYVYPNGLLSAYVLTLYENNKETFTTKIKFYENGSHFVYPSEQQLKKNKL